MSQRGGRLAAVAVLAPSLLFVAANLLEHAFGSPWLSDALGWFAEPTGDVAEPLVTATVLLGPPVALALAVAPLVRLRLGRRAGSVEASASLRLAWANLVVALVALSLATLLAGYVVAENAACWFGTADVC